MNDVIDTFEGARAKLLGLAYRITGSAFEAEDIVHETFLKWHDADHPSIKSPQSWLCTVASRLAVDHLRSSCVMREEYMGTWLPEPFIENKDNPDSSYEIDESITMALLVLLEKLSPEERVVYILHDLFHFGFSEVADILEKPSVTCRKMASRARSKIDKDRIRYSHDSVEHQEVIHAFFSAVKQGDISGLVNVLQSNVSFHSDGGGKAFALPHILKGLDVVVDVILTYLTSAVESGSHSIDEVWFNGAPGFLVSDGGQPVSAFNFEISDKKIQAIHVLRNPEKLKFFDTKTCVDDIQMV
jgi:RNA polymerase sigma factor, sigma-70 family